MAKIQNIHGLEAEVYNISFEDYKRGRYQKSASRIYRVGSGECGFYIWEGVLYANKREVELDYASVERNLQAWIEGKI